jgi:CheY-like chemotaxis protein
MTTPAPSILIVEDDIHLRVLLSAILTQAGYRVRTVEEGFSALSEIRIEIPDIIVSDLYMSGMFAFGGPSFVPGDPGDRHEQCIFRQ